MAEVVGLNGKPVDPAVAYDGGLVDMLERAIGLVKSGKARGIGLIVVSTNDPMDIDTSYQGRRLELIAGASRLLHHLHIEQDEANDAN